MLDVRNRALAQVTRADDFIVSGKLVSLTMSQLAENPALRAVFDDLFDEQGSEIYLKPAADYVRLDEPVDFYTIVESARRRGEVAFGYRLLALAEDAARNYGVELNPDKAAPDHLRRVGQGHRPRRGLTLVNGSAGCPSRNYVNRPMTHSSSLLTTCQATFDVGVQPCDIARTADQPSVVGEGGGSMPVPGGVVIMGSPRGRHTFRRACTALFAAAVMLSALALPAAAAPPANPVPENVPAPVEPVEPGELNNNIESVIAAARSHLGVPYRVGSEGPSLFDCSGLMYRIFRGDRPARSHRWRATSRGRLHALVHGPRPRDHRTKNSPSAATWWSTTTARTSASTSATAAC